MLSRRRFLRLGVLAATLLSGCSWEIGGEGTVDGTDGEPSTPVELVAGESLYYVAYGYGGGMDGGSESIELTRADDGSALLAWSHKETWNMTEKSKNLRLDASTFDEFERLALECDLRGASEQPESEYQALDAAVEHITLAYVDEDGDMDVDSMFSVSETQELDQAQLEGFRAVIAALKELAE